jgi:hypothetical protein
VVYSDREAGEEWVGGWGWKGGGVRWQGEEGDGRGGCGSGKEKMSRVMKGDE